MKVKWDEKGLVKYQSILSTTLPLLESSLYSPDSPSLTSILLDCTNYALNRAAQLSFKTLSLSNPKPNKSTSICPELLEAQVAALTASKSLRSLLSAPSPSQEDILKAKEVKSSCSAALRSAARAHNSKVARQRDQLLHSVLSEDPRKLYAAVRSSKSAGSPTLHTLQVGKNIYSGDGVPDGFFDALLILKVPGHSPNNKPDSLSSTNTYSTILEICKSSPPIPSLSLKDAEALLKRVRPNVLDYFSISARHYSAAGVQGIQHLASLLILIISNINLTPAAELNSAWSVMLHKGHNKPRSQCRSWRCISTCPLLSKVLDLYVADRHRDNWTSAAAKTQFMTRGSTHELAALLLSEVVCYALGISLWVLLLDKQSAFDSVLKEDIISEAYTAAGYQADQSLLYMAHGLSSRRTFLQYSPTIMGPIYDQRGVEQGGVSSGGQFQLVNNKELIVTNTAGLGSNMGAISIGSIGVADDVALVSPSPHALQSLLNLSQSLTSSRSMVNVPEKTKLLVYQAKGQDTTYWQAATPITMGGSPIPLSSQAEHVGVLRSPGGSNLASITSRIASHTKSLYSVISCGLARNHRGNPAASLRVESSYSAPKLFSSLASLFLSPSDLQVLTRHRRQTL